jgi:hypothetical protein
MKINSEALRGILIASVLWALPVLSEAQVAPSAQEIDLVSAAVRQVVTDSVLPNHSESVIARLDSILASKNTVWDKPTDWKIRVRNAHLNAEFSLHLGELMWFEFVPRESHLRPIAGVEPISEIGLRATANRVLQAQCEAPWSVGPIEMETLGPVVGSLWARPLRNGLPYATHRVRVWIDRVSGCVTFLDRSFAFLPESAHNERLELTSEVEQQVQAIALDAYARWQPLDVGSVVWQEASYNIPNWERHDNEMTALHHQLAAEKKVTPVYRVSLLGTRGTSHFSVSIFVDLLTRLPIAITEIPLDESLQLSGLGVKPSDPDSTAHSHLDGRVLEGEWQNTDGDLSSDSLILLKSKAGALVLYNVDKKNKCVWRRDLRNDAVVSLRCEDRTWAAIVTTIEKPRRSFGRRED